MLVDVQVGRHVIHGGMGWRRTSGQAGVRRRRIDDTKYGRSVGLSNDPAVVWARYPQAPREAGVRYSKSRVLTTGTSVVCRRGNDHCGGDGFPRDNKRNLVVRLRVQQWQVAGPTCTDVQELRGYCFLLT